MEKSKQMEWMEVRNRIKATIKSIDECVDDTITIDTMCARDLSHIIKCMDSDYDQDSPVDSVTGEVNDRNRTT